MHNKMNDRMFLVPVQFFLDNRKHIINRESRAIDKKEQR
jgi:hypothetical protein